MNQPFYSGKGNKVANPDTVIHVFERMYDYFENELRMGE